MNKFKQILFILIILLASYVMLECISYLLLITVLKSEVTIDYNNTERLIKSFPAQFRMRADEIRGMFPQAMPLQAVGNYMSLPFDPVMGFRRDDAPEWFGGSLDNLEGKYLIVTFGGSTTVKDSWAKYLPQYAQIENVKQDIVVFNAGHWGYMTFIEKIYFTAWILPMLEKAGAKPDLVLTMDGVNDIWARVMGYIESEKQKAPLWYSHYHGYHQHLDTDMKRLGGLTGSASQLLSSIGRKSYSGIIRYMAPYAPYTLKGILELSRRIIQMAPAREEVVKLASKNILDLEDDVEDAIITAYKSSLIDFLGSAQVRGIEFVAYLQPVLLEKYYPFPIPESFDYPDFNYFAMHFHMENKFFSRLGGNFIVRTGSLYNKAEKMYLDLNTEYSKHFKNLAHIFKEMPQAELVYNKDAIHYEEMGKEAIAHTVIKDLIAKDILQR